MSISYTERKINLILGILVILSFFLGIGLILLNFGQKQAQNITFVARDITVPQKVVEEELEVFASKDGTKYYYAGCAGLKRIKKENVITFASKELAEKAGYSLAANCKQK